MNKLGVFIMNKTLLIAILLTLGSSVVLAEQGGYVGPSSNTTSQQGGFTGPKSTGAVTVVQAKQMRDDSKVVLRGTIVKQLGHEKYLFKDNTGEITIEIDDDDWHGLTIGPNDQVEIFGEVDKDWNSVEIDVDSVRKVS